METKGLLFGSIRLERAGHVFLMVGIIHLLMSSAAWRGWSIPGGDASNNAPLSKRDSGEVARDEYSLDHERPANRSAIPTNAALFYANLAQLLASFGAHCK